MSKGRILSHLGNAQYSVEIEIDRTYIDTQITRKTNERDDIESNRLPPKEQERADKFVELQTAESEYQTALNAVSACIGINGALGCSAERANAETKLKAKLKLQIEYQTLREICAEYEAAVVELTKEIAFLNTAPNQFSTVSIYSADACAAPTGDPLDDTWLGYGHLIPNNTEIEVLDVYSNSAPNGRFYQVIAPAFGSNYATPITIEKPALGMTASEAAWWSATFAPTEVWKPTYRAATVNSVANDRFANITLDTCTDDPFLGWSTDLNLNSNVGSVMSGVEIQYHNLAPVPPIDTGSRVVVKFTSATTAVIIGYLDNPQPIQSFDVVVTVNDGMTYTGDLTQKVLIGTDSTPVEITDSNWGYWDDGNDDNPRVFTDVRENKSVTANAYFFPSHLGVGWVRKNLWSSQDERNPDGFGGLEGYSTPTFTDWPLITAQPDDPIVTGNDTLYTFTGLSSTSSSHPHCFGTFIQNTFGTNIWFMHMWEADDTAFAQPVPAMIKNLKPSGTLGSFGNYFGTQEAKNWGWVYLPTPDYEKFSVGFVNWSPGSGDYYTDLVYENMQIGVGKADGTNVSQLGQPGNPLQNDIILYSGNVSTVSRIGSWVYGTGQGWTKRTTGINVWDHLVEAGVYTTPTTVTVTQGGHSATYQSMSQYHSFYGYLRFEKISET